MEKKKVKKTAGNTAKAYTTPLFKAAQEGDMEKVKQLVSNKADVELGKKVRASNYSPLMIAAEKGHLEIVRYLVAQAADVNATADINSFGKPRLWTPLMQAASENHEAVVKFLLSKGADIHFVDNLGWGVVRAALKDPEEKDWEQAEKQAHWLIKKGAPITPFAKETFDKIDAYRNSQRKVARNKVANKDKNKGVKYHVLLTWRPDKKFTIGDFPKGGPKGYEYTDGKSLKAKFPKKAIVTLYHRPEEGEAKKIDFMKELEKSGGLTDFISMGLDGDILITKKHVYDLLVKLGADNLEFLPVQIESPGKQVVSGDYGFLNVLGAQECIDMEKSKVVMDSFFPDQIFRIKKLVMDRSNIDETAMIFRAARKLDQLFVRDDVAQAFKKANFKGYELANTDGPVIPI